jgi:hypothetical protein
MSWNEEKLKKLVKLRDVNDLTWDQISHQFKNKVSPNNCRKAYYRFTRKTLPKLKKKKTDRTHIVIPDCQVKSGVDISYLTSIGNYIATKKPDVIVCIGDFADMPSLSSYDVGKKSFEGRRYKTDIQATIQGMELLMAPIHAAMSEDPEWKPELHLTLGNHEERILRAINNDPKLDGTISMDDLQYETFGWKVHDYLVPVVVDGIAYSHFFTSGAMGRPVSSASALVKKRHMSAIMGHAQDWGIHREVRADGSSIIGLFVGACYLHDEDYLGPQGNNYGRQIWVLHEVENGSFLPKPVSLKYLQEHYTEIE